MTDDRSERLRKRRKQSTETRQQEQQADPEQVSATASQTNSRNHTDRSGAESSTAEPGGGTTVSIKEEQVGTYMYLPESQTKELRRLYNILKAEYEFEYDDEFEKNRHFYPLVIQYGLEHLDGLDASEIRDHLEEIT